jgi:hypothetical protein
MNKEEKIYFTGISVKDNERREAVLIIHTSYKIKIKTNTGSQYRYWYSPDTLRALFRQDFGKLGKPVRGGENKIRKLKLKKLQKLNR